MVKKKENMRVKKIKGEDDKKEREYEG